MNNMNLQENIQRIHQMMGVITENKTSDFVTIDVYDGEEYDRHKSSFTERYEDLDDNTLDEVFLFMVDALEHYK